MMISWLCAGFFTHAAMVNEHREVLFQSQKEDKAAELVDDAKTLYDQQNEVLKRRFPLTKPILNRRLSEAGVRKRQSDYQHSRRCRPDSLVPPLGS